MMFTRMKLLIARTEFNREEQKKEDYLRRADIFEPLEDEDIQMLVSSGRHWFYGRGERIVRQAESGDSLFLILDGSASVYVKVKESGEEVRVGTAGNRRLFWRKITAYRGAKGSKC
ncbi:MAG: cyclic nucleotide-binding domain-containing protein [Balneolaceae bacterium]|nr:cyclic nucleotide-binding domain-containing protein [Balneolaceae bacterium]